MYSEIYLGMHVIIAIFATGYLITGIADHRRSLKVSREMQEINKRFDRLLKDFE